MTKLPILVICALLLLSLCVLPGCGNTTSESQIITSANGLTQIEIPSDWNIMSDLNEDYDIQTGNDEESAYAMVLSELKAAFDYDFTYKDYTESVTDMLMSNLENPVITSGPEDLEINGHPAVQYEISGSVYGIQVVYLYTIIDGSYNFHQVLTFTSLSQYEQNLPVMRTITNSFKEITS